VHGNQTGCFLCFFTTSSIGVSKVSLTKATAILRYGLEVGTKDSEIRFGKEAIFSIPE
jgi:hypothetical protein